ncbi:VanZ family protein [Lewinella sp. IMCC34191]|uniref:VanZ family protein n=1 Tax=Lewinella sp. IMCC34191 TaxID=2259172 RepID=UPI000E23D194
MAEHPPRFASSASGLRTRKVIRLITLVYALVLTYVSLAPGQQIPGIFDWSELFSPDKIAHFGAYAFFAVLLSFAIGKASPGKRTATAVLAAALFGALMEVLQGVSGLGREFDLVDMVANLIGAILGGAFYLLYRQIVYKYLTPVGS